jgi:putative ABC transport system ATP-binding protein
MGTVLLCRNIHHTYGRGEVAESVLAGVSASFAAGEVCVLMGPSGSGKTTLLSILGCMLKPSAGELTMCGESVDWQSPGRLTYFRRVHLGFVFQHAQLLPFLTVVENLEVVGRNAGLSAKAVTGRIDELLKRLGIAAMRHKKPDHLSGGQRQRVAIARAVLHRPSILLADEPTAALDWHHGQEVVRLLVEQAHEERAMLLTVTHDTRLLPLFRRVLRIEEGRLTEESCP